MTTTYADGPGRTVPDAWRTRDIVVTAVIGVAFGLAFLAFGLLWRAFEGLGPFQNVLYGVWLMPAVVAALIVRKPGAALFAEMVAAGLSAVLGSTWGIDTLLSGFVQGAAAEMVFALTMYRVWSFPVLAAASLASAAAAFVHDWALYWSGYAPDVLALIGVWMAVSALVILPVASILLVRALRETGALDGFPA
jgi:energy-coupling factor transport system substrate-specific component